MTERLQGIFDTMVTRLLKQGRKSMGVAGGCRYRGGVADCCAVGALIDDAHYDEALEGKNVKSLFVLAAIEKSLGFTLTDKEYAVIARCQLVHDQSVPEDWADRFAQIAATYGLKMPVAA